MHAAHHGNIVFHGLAHNGDIMGSVHSWLSLSRCCPCFAAASAFDDEDVIHGMRTSPEHVVAKGSRVSVAILGTAGLGKSMMFELVNRHFRPRQGGRDRDGAEDVAMLRRAYAPTIGIDMCTFECTYDRPTGTELWDVARRNLDVAPTSRALREYIHSQRHDPPCEHGARSAERRCLRSRVICWDTSGAEQFVPVIVPYISSANVLFLMYDANDVDSLEYLHDHWVSRVRGARSVAHETDHHVVMLRLSTSARDTSSCTYQQWRSMRTQAHPRFESRQRLHA